MSPEIYSLWLEAAKVDYHILSMPGNSSLIGLTSRMGQPQTGIWLAILISGVTIVFIYRANQFSDKQNITVSSAGVFLSLLASPISWAGYTILTLPYFLSQKKWSLATTLAAAILTVPFNITMHLYYYFGTFNFIFWGWWYGIALMICFGQLLLSLWKSREYADNE